PGGRAGQSARRGQRPRRSRGPRRGAGSAGAEGNLDPRSRRGRPADRGSAMKVLAGDIGGTHARLAIVRLDGGARIIPQQAANRREVSSLATLVESFLAAQPERPAHGCLGIAGPVVDGIVSGTNLPWVLSAPELAASLGIPGLRLINDFEAAAYGVSVLSD